MSQKTLHWYIKSALSCLFICDFIAQRCKRLAEKKKIIIRHHASRKSGKRGPLLFSVAPISKAFFIAFQSFNFKCEGKRVYFVHNFLPQLSRFGPQKIAHGWYNGDKECTTKNNLMSSKSFCLFVNVFVVVNIAIFKTKFVAGTRHLDSSIILYFRRVDSLWTLLSKENYWSTTCELCSLLLIIIESAFSNPNRITSFMANFKFHFYSYNWDSYWNFQVL